MRKHIAMKCTDGRLVKLQGIVVVESTESTEPYRTKPGPKPFDMATYVRGRLPAFTTQGDDDRIEYLFSSDLVETLFGTRAKEIPAFLFHHLWSSRAPEHFQSLVMYRNSIHEITSCDLDTGDVTYAVRGTLTKRFIKEFAVYALELAYAIAKDSVPSRLPERIPEARHLFDRLCHTIDGMTLRDAIKQSGSYTKHSFATRHKLDETLSKLYDIMTHSFANCFT